MPYDPQRSHRRPRLSDDSPAPIDSLLGEERESEGPHEPHGSNGDRPAPVVTAEAALGPDAAPVHAASSESETTARSARSRPKLALLAVAVVALLLLLAWARRRRR